MEGIVTAKWPSLFFRGIASIAFGVIALAWPGITLAALTLLFGAYAFVDGIIALVVAVQRGARPHRWLLVVDGLLGIGAGVVTLLWPGLTLLALILLVGARFTVTGAFQIAAAIKLRHEMHAPVLYGLAGLASIAVGILTFIMPGLSALVLLTFLAVYAFIFGIVMLVLAFRARSAGHRIPAHAPA
jgi:uncharacterized membrane protein HdeD (DUF308 family)